MLASIITLATGSYMIFHFYNKKLRFSPLIFPGMALILLTISLKLLFNFNQRLFVKIIIGVTREPEKIKTYLSEHYGKEGTLTEVGPFVSRFDADNWLVYLKSRIGNFQEIIPEVQSGQDDLWYGFTFEQKGQE